MNKVKLHCLKEKVYAIIYELRYDKVYTGPYSGISKLGYSEKTASMMEGLVDVGGYNYETAQVSRGLLSQTKVLDKRL